MRKLAVVSLLAGVLLLALAAPGLAYDGVQGCIVNADGTPWTGGGSVTVGGPSFPWPGYTDPIPLDENGCYYYDCAYFSPFEVTFDPGTGIDPHVVCSVPASDPGDGIYQCANVPVGPNSVTLSGLTATAGSVLPAGLSLAALGGTLGGFAIWRRRQ